MTMNRTKQNKWYQSYLTKLKWRRIKVQSYYQESWLLLKAQTNLKAHVKYFFLMMSFTIPLVQPHLSYTICIKPVFNRKDFWAFWENKCKSFSLGSLLNQSRTYQGNLCGVYPDLSSISRSGVLQILWLVPSDPLLVRITSSVVSELWLSI